MSPVEKAGGVEYAEALRTLALTLPVRWLEREPSPPSLLEPRGAERRTGWIKANIFEDRGRGIWGPVTGPAESRRRRLETMRKRWGP